MTPVAPGEPVIQIRDLRKLFRLGFARRMPFEALQGVSFEVKRGQTFGFLGPNGAGKTTTIKILTGLIFATSGEVSILGEPPTRAATRRRFGYLPENPSFHDHLTGREVLEFACGLLGVPRASRPERIKTVLEQVKLTYAADIQVRRYSKGMTQRLGIAQALVHQPELVIFDEPMSGLDPIGRRDVKDLMQALRREGRTVFFSTHIISDVQEICDEVAIIIGGKLTRSGAVSQFLGEEAREVDIIASNVPADFPELAGRNNAGAVSFQAATPAEARALVERLWQAGAQVLSMNVRKFSLEDVFMAEVAKRPINRGRQLED